MTSHIVVAALAAAIIGCNSDRPQAATPERGAAAPTHPEGQPASSADDTAGNEQPSMSRSTTPEPAGMADDATVEQSSMSRSAAPHEPAGMASDALAKEPPINIPPGGSADFVLEIPMDDDEQDAPSGGGLTAETTLRYPDSAAGLTVRVERDQNSCHVDSASVTAFAVIPTMVKSDSAFHRVTLIWSIDCETGPGKRCRGVAARLFSKEGVMTTELFRMRGLHVAERSEGRAMLQWEQNWLIVDAGGGMIWYTNASLRAGYSGTGAASCRDVRPHAP